MVNLFKRMRKLRSKILHVRVGPGAAILPSTNNASKDFPAVTRLHLTYARKLYGGHLGARHFWRNCLQRLKFYNPGIPMSVKQTDEQNGPAALTIYFAERASAAALKHSAHIKDQYAPAPQPNEKTAIIDTKDLDYKQIWQKVQEATGAQEVKATPEEEEELKKLEQMRIKSEEDRARVIGIRQAKKDQERMLQEARGEVERLRQM
ncbi:hypothetical protein DTO166G4_5546 [Paecilomyces variotii]|uniref:50S ribosomal protein Mrp49 n=1 Tax=Byssochlamys spectabilis TaxID=264951 RepID=A0A443HXZ2_BYSSP|nr:50S ribosomal protein Mrp49 [Paecilomyces variotii]KAJ9203120.1 hypothetical protein DTO164E3_2591 [Paecilomyces variotii]KAJ9208645.1 hypothetical protein DTO032I3_622 [Paecilomyces variotii]KAJ9212889.1 hypothetical protein DTO166G4_5546 [Paecilomyces variotii]KAJ9223698.1 hypothetical protein DTO169C6_4050 [Paecilomyces variotii]KAJ9229421.1 hypothetical protein DTO169E5_8877 [Paecilomyces variotii]